MPARYFIVIVPKPLATLTYLLLAVHQSVIAL